MRTPEARESPRCSQRLLDALSHKVHQHLGMDFSGARQSDLLRKLIGLAQAQGRDADSWLEELAFADWNANRIQTLVPAFSVGETYFRRDAEAFDWLVRHHLIPLLDRRRNEGRRHLRLWSAACCTGEEAYGLLFVIDELLGAERDSWSIELLATDINEEFLTHARQGVYGRNAFRGDDAAFRDRYFEPDGSRWRVRSTWRERIRFARFNLADGRKACPMPGADVILCRNVLMYFSQPRAVSALRRLLADMDRDGLLLLTSVEAAIATQAGLSGRIAGNNYALPAVANARHGQHQEPPRVIPSPAVIAKSGPRLAAPKQSRVPATLDKPQQPAVEVASEPAQLWTKAEQALAAGQLQEARDILGAYLQLIDSSPALRHKASLLMAQSWADEQNIQHAKDWLQRALAADANSPAAYWLLALLEQQHGNHPAAIQALQKAIYLDPGFILAYFLQARLLKAEGRIQASLKALQVCRQLLLQQDKNDLVPHSDGMSCAQLLRLCEQIQDKDS